MVWSGFYALHGANQDWNRGQVSLLLETDVFRERAGYRASDRSLLPETLRARRCTLGGEPHLVTGTR